MPTTLYVTVLTISMKYNMGRHCFDMSALDAGLSETELMVA
jgi:hypothetical protein